MASSRLEYLFRQCISGACTEEEREELLFLMQLPEHEAQARALIREAVPSGNELSLDRAAADAILQAIFQADTASQTIIQADAAPQAISATSPHRSWRRYAAVAAVLVALMAGLYLFTSRSNRPAKKAVTALQDVPPGSNKAILTLADGSAVTLDSTGTQVIRQGNSAIHQYKGQLQYTTQQGPAAPSYNTLTTPRGGQFRISLPDGTKVWLNSASSLRYPTCFTGKERIVELQGQGYFEVARNAGQPFRVKVWPGMEVEVLGTHFDIMAYPDERTVNTTLLEGAVKVTSGRQTGTLRPGQQAVLYNREHTISIRKVDVNKVIAWKSGLFMFNNTDLGSILREISRWYDVEIIHEEAINSDELYGGSISRNQNLSDVLNLLESGGSSHFKIEGRKVILLPQ